MISKLQIYGMLDYGRDGFRRIWKKIKIIKSCCYIYLVAVMATVWQGFSVVTNAFTTANDRWLAIILSAELLINILHRT